MNPKMKIPGLVHLREVCSSLAQRSLSRSASWTRLFAVGLTLAVWALSQVLEPANSDWPQWRGSHGAGISLENGLPDRWAPGSPEIQWRTPIPGKARSSPIISGNRVFLTTASLEAQTVSLLEFTGLLLAGLAFILVNSRIRLFCSSVSVAIAWLLFACLMAACLANDVERINKPIARLHPLAALLVLLGVAVVWSTGSWGWCLVSSLLFLLFTSAAAAPTTSLADP